MRFAYYLTDGLEQFVLTPESDAEKRLVSMLSSRDGVDISIYAGEFYECRGGWVREGRGDDSAILVIRKSDNPEKEPAPPIDAEQYNVEETGL